MAPRTVVVAVDSSAVSKDALSWAAKSLVRTAVGWASPPTPVVEPPPRPSQGSCAAPSVSGCVETVVRAKGGWLGSASADAASPRPPARAADPPTSLPPADTR